MTTSTNQFMQVAKSTFISNTTSCAATLYSPSALKRDSLPAILMIHGWGGIQNALTGNFYKQFVQAGFAVMSFDYGGWGESEGQPRNEINPWQRLRDAENALKHLKRQANIDTTRIILWGTSFGGGHVVDLAAKHPELLGAIAQVPMLDGMAAAKSVPFSQLLRLGAYAFADSLRAKGPIYIPVVGPLGGLSTMDRDGAYEALMRGIQEAGLDYDNRVTARSVLTMGFYRPFKNLKKIRIPMLLIGAKNDTVAPFVEQKIRQQGNPLISIRHIDANHFEPYFEPALTQNLAFQLEFLESLNSRKANTAQ